MDQYETRSRWLAEIIVLNAQKDPCEMNLGEIYQLKALLLQQNRECLGECYSLNHWMKGISTLYKGVLGRRDQLMLSYLLSSLGNIDH